jgi:integrase/recombinase XerD
LIIREKALLAAENPHIWVYNGKDISGKYRLKGFLLMMPEALKKTNIQKQRHMHLLGWEEQITQVTLPVRHYHIIFTVH